MSDDLRNVFEEFFEAIPYPTLIYDPDGKLVAINGVSRSIAERLGFELASDLTYEEVVDLVADGYIGEICSEKLDAWRIDQVRARKLAIETGEPVEAERFDGTWQLLQTIKTPSGYFVDMRADITTQKARQEELARAEARAAAADRAKSQFLANMSHEIRTPMNGVMGMAELLAEMDLTPKQKSFADIIVKSGESLLTIINDILDFSKIDAGEMELHPKPFDLADAIEDVAILVSAKASEKGLELAVRSDPALPPMLVGDAGRIRQVVANLMTNAVKFTEKGHVLVDVCGEVSDGEQGETAKLTVRIEDTGVGIPEEKQATIFDKFTQVDNSATRTHEGTGLGLSICKSLIELMGGSVGLESTLGEGSVFWFEVELPVHADARKDVDVPIDVTGARVLVVDDNAVNRSILEEQMNAWQFNVKTLASGNEAVQAIVAAHAENAPYDVVVLDYHMPELNGFEVAQKIRSHELIDATPIVMLTSVDQTGVDETLSALDISSHLVKPAKSSLLRESVVAAIHSGRNTPVTDKPKKDKRSSHAMEVSGKARKKSRTKSTDQDATPDILVAEDNAINVTVFSQILDGLDYSYEVVANGRLAVEACKKHRPSLIVMDIAMPELNGYEATHAIREWEEASGGARSAIIGVTAYAMSDDRAKCLNAGMDDYLAKPISPKRLTEKIEQWLAVAGCESSSQGA